MRKLLLINGPNLNMLGKREPSIYGGDTLKDIEQRLILLAKEEEASLALYQSNSEGELVSRVHKALEDGIEGIIINPGAYTHTSLALRDAFLATQIPFIEVHISNVYAREEFRHHSYFSDIAKGVIAGLGTEGYALALSFLLQV